VYDADGQAVTSFLAYESTFTGGVRVAVADLDADGLIEVVTGAGPGGGPRVRVFDGATGAAEADFFAYEQTFTGGVWVAAGPIGDGDIGIATGADAGGGPRVRVFEADGTVVQDFFAFGPSFTGGVRVALGQSEGGPKVYTASGSGMAPTVHAYDVATAGLLFEVTVGDEAETGGVWLSAGDVSGDGADDLVTAVASGTDTDLRLFDGTNGYWANQMIVGGACQGLGVMNWAGQAAVGVLSGGTLTAYVFAPAFNDPPSSPGSITPGGSGALGGQAPVLLPEVLATDSATLTGLGEAEVEMTVTRLAPNRYRWEYVVTNTQFLYPSTTWPYPGDIGYFVLEVPDEVRSLITNRGTDQPWTAADGLFGEPNIFWSTPEGGHLEYGGSARFWFETPAIGLAQSRTSVWDSYGAVSSSAEGFIDGPAAGPRIVITYANGSEVGAAGLKVAKWQDAFELAPNGILAEVKGPDAGLDFIDRDPDRFNVWVYDPARWGDAQVQHIQATIQTTNVVGFTEYNDNPTPVDLVKYGGAGKGPGWFWSDSQMLVSNEADDKHSAATYLGADESGPGAAGLPKNGYTAATTWKISDRTHRVALRGTVRAEYTPTVGPLIAATAGVPVTKNVKVHTTILKVMGTPVLNLAEANHAVHKANESFAQVGVLLIPAIQFIDPPAGVDLSNGLDGFTTPGPSETAEEQALMVPGTRTAATDDVELYFVNFIVGGGTSEWKGESFPAYAVSDSKYADSVIIAKNYYSLFTVAHELGHVLLDDGTHYTGPVRTTNLMRNGGTSAIDLVTGSKRWTPGQATDILSKRPNLLTGP
jgi:hypothetical protein